MYTPLVYGRYMIFHEKRARCTELICRKSSGQKLLSFQLTFVFYLFIYLFISHEIGVESCYCLLNYDT
jgi:hypothetical protein